MSFLYPLFLIAGLSLAIPVLIHLFNLRRYKTILFPHTRFLRSIQLNSRKQSEVRYKWLLAARLLFLTFLILAFAQPFLSKDNKKAGNRLQVIYIDNSYSMLVKKGAGTLLDLAKEAARKQVRQAHPGSRFLLLTNDKPGSYQPLPADKILTEINNINASSATKTAAQTMATVQSLMPGQATDGADIYYYSDFQHTSMPAIPDASLMKNINFYGAAVQNDEAQNIYIDTAYLTMPVLQTGQSNQLVVRSKAIGSLPKENPVLQLAVNGQVKSAATLKFNDKNESSDTLSFQVNDANWQHISLTINDASLLFDDTFRVSARSTPNLAVMVLNEGQASPYIQAAFRAYNGFRLNQVDVNNASVGWKEYNLVILNGITKINDQFGKAIATALQEGQSVCIFPGRTADVNAINEGLKQVGDIRFNTMDTATQTASNLQEGSALVRDLFEKIPDNVQLPTASWHYVISAGLSANQQSILSFRNGDPFLAQYTPSKGKLYICATSADLQSGNFPGSYFFVPFIYQMAMQSRSGDIYAVTTGRQQPVYLSLHDADERNTVHIYNKGTDIIPPQRPAGAGLEVYIDQAVQQPGFYNLAALNSDTTVVALNENRSESQLNNWNISTLKNQWKGSNINWLDIKENGVAIKAESWNSFPLWKVCAILALLMLAAETFLLAGSFRKQTVAAQ